ncbi:hypothetical protein E2C01_029113 [Portunus trituberculatus]|uniref:Uncharacterized protein n=1 Tax=Portunus trituberculatus TaxID=210409 RepID=A0A5B7ETS7_PORTR|nr:hypothetical protein [Portunus trituberculatus]
MLRLPAFVRLGELQQVRQRPSHHHVPEEITLITHRRSPYSPTLLRTSIQAWRAPHHRSSPPRTAYPLSKL